MQLLIEFRYEFRRLSVLQPRVTTVADDLEQPSARVSATKSVKEAVRSEHSFLHHILGIVRIAQKPPRQVHRSIDVRQHQ